MYASLDGYTDLPPGKLANVATYLEMFERPAFRPDRATGSAEVRQVARPETAWYREMFRRVGTPYLWMSRLRIGDEALRAIVHDPNVEVATITVDGVESGLLELDFREARECELAFFGLTQNALGRGMGRRLMNYAIERAWSKPIARFWVHTCSLDDPGALGFYIRSGFVPFKRQIEIMDDPRLIGLLPRDAAPNVPLL